MGKIIRIGDEVGGSSGGAWKGSVEFRADLPITIGTPAIGDIYLVEKPTTILLGLYKTYQSGLYIRDFDNGNLSDWRKLNVKVKYTDSEFAIVNSLDESSQAKYDISLIDTSTTRTYQHQNKDGVLAHLGDIYMATGWADYADNIYTSGSPFPISSGVTYVLPNNSGTTIDFQKPSDILTFYDSSTLKLTGRNGDGINITIEFKVKPTTASITKITTFIDIGGAVGEIYNRDFILTKGSGVEHSYLSSFNAYTLSTWESNGGQIKIIADANAEVYDIRYVVTRTHKAN